MLIFLIKIYEKSWTILDIDFPFNRITLRAEKALRVTFLVSHKNLSALTTFSKTHRQTQRIHSWMARRLRNLKKMVLG